MSEKKYVVPEGMLKAGVAGTRDIWLGVRHHDQVAKGILEAALRWLAENPDAGPTPEQAMKMHKVKANLPLDPYEWVRWGACEWVRRMFLAPEPEIPEAVKDLLCDPVNAVRGVRFGDTADRINDLILEAYRRGTLSQSEK